MSHGVVHLKRARFDVRIDRQTHWGNPFVIGKDGTREQVLKKYRAWLHEPGNEHMFALAKKELRGKVLGCWCAPKACHGDVLAEIANCEHCDEERKRGCRHCCWCGSPLGEEVR